MPYFHGLKDLEIDCPYAPKLMKTVISALMQAECLSRYFITDHFSQLDSAYQADFLSLAP
jgi:hypothetical protein